MADRSAEQLLVHAGWLRGLALRLVRDGDVADDLTQPGKRRFIARWLCER